MDYDYKAERRKRGLSQQQLADLADVSLSTVANAEQGRSVSSKMLRTLRDAIESFAPGGEPVPDVKDEVAELRRRVEELEAAVRFLMRAGGTS